MILAVTNQKGGVGKTTSVLNIGVYLTTLGKKVLLVDNDPQANLSSSIGYEKGEKKKTLYNLMVNRLDAKDVIIPTRIANLDLIPAGIELAGAEVEIVNFLSRESILKKALENAKNKYDFILIDCPPSLGLLTINALVCADKVLIPVQSEYFALEGVGQLINTIKLIKNNLNHNLDVGGVILTMFDSRTNLSKEVETELKKFFNDKVFKTIVPRNIKLSEAPSHALSIHEYAPASTGALSYKELSLEIVERFEDSNKLERPNLAKRP